MPTVRISHALASEAALFLRRSRWVAWWVGEGGLGVGGGPDTGAFLPQFGQ
jgi:hypothetical protein